MFGGCVFVDQLPPNDSNVPAVYIFSRPFNLKSLKYRESLQIYTTKLLKLLIPCSTEVHQSIGIIDDSGQPVNIQLTNEKTVCIRAFSYGSKTLNVLILLECDGQFNVYAGRCIANDTILNCDFFANLMFQRKINDLYFDGRAIKVNEFNLMRSACVEIRSLISSNKRYKFEMLIDDFGYEDLVFALAQGGLKIRLDPRSNRMFQLQELLEVFHQDSSDEDADLVLINRLPADMQRRYDEENIITMKLSTGRLQSTDALRIVKYTFYPTQSDIHFLTHLTAPQRVHDVSGSDAAYADFLIGLCQPVTNAS